ncbi:hypothetical protein LPJ81_001397 [Coemansia sp. IMI 209127]|nr:hypothetical protein LPJ81_001397 [Coemansia sp. IMI 209127]
MAGLGIVSNVPTDEKVDVSKCATEAKADAKVDDRQEEPISKSTADAPPEVVAGTQFHEEPKHSSEAGDKSKPTQPVEAAKKPVKRTDKEADKEPVKEADKEPVKEAVKKPVKEVAKVASAAFVVDSCACEDSSGAAATDLCCTESSSTQDIHARIISSIVILDSYTSSSYPYSQRIASHNAWRAYFFVGCNAHLHAANKESNDHSRRWDKGSSKNRPSLPFNITTSFRTKRQNIGHWWIDFAVGKILSKHYNTKT